MTKVHELKIRSKRLHQTIEELERKSVKSRRDSMAWTQEDLDYLDKKLGLDNIELWYWGA